MRIVLAAVIVLAAAWSGYWWIGARAEQNGIRNWLDARDRAGWVANYSMVETTGFPNRFDTTISEIELADPETGVAWAAPFLQLLRLSYEPNHVIAVWPDEQTFASPYQRISVTTDRARASFVFLPRTDYQLERSNFSFEGVRLRSTKDWSARVENVRLATRPADAGENAYDIGFEATGLRPKGTKLSQLAEIGLVPETFETLKLDATLAFDAPWDRTALEERRPAITEIELNLAQAIWGELDLWMAGDVTLDEAGRATGEITVKARNWREMLQLAVAAGWLPDGMADTLEGGLELLAGLSGSPKTLDAPLKLRDGAVSFGPIPLGTLPPIRIR